MGRYYWDKKATVEDCRSLRVKFLKENGYFEQFYISGGISWFIGETKTSSIWVAVDKDNEYVRVQYSFTHETDEAKKHRDYKIKLTKTSCYFGGFRYWLLCPFCNKKMGKLYLLGRNDFACRHCLDLSYESRNKGGIWKMMGETKGLYELEEMKEKIKTKFYKGKPTKRYLNYLKHEEKLFRSMLVADSILQRSL